MAAAITIIPTRWCAAAIASCRSTSMSRAVRRPPKRCSTAFCSCRRRSGAPRASRARQPTMPLTHQELGQHLLDSLPGAVERAEDLAGELTVTVAGASIVPVLSFLRDDPKCVFKQLMDVCGVDYPERERRFDVVYHLLSLKLNQR